MLAWSVIRAHGGEMVIYAFSSGDIPFHETNDGTASAQMCPEQLPGDTDRFFGDHICIVGNDNPTTCPP